MMSQKKTILLESNVSNVRFIPNDLDSDKEFRLYFASIKHLTHRFMDDYEIEYGTSSSDNMIIPFINLNEYNRYITFECLGELYRFPIRFEFDYDTSEYYCYVYTLDKSHEYVSLFNIALIQMIQIKSYLSHYLESLEYE
jgi:hypothetical protein